MKNKSKASAMVYYLASLCFYIAAFINHFGNGESVIMNIMLGCTFLCLGSVHLAKDKKTEDEDKKETEPTEEKEQ